MKLLIPILALLLGACSPVGIERIAHYESEFPENDYVIVLKGSRALMAHDPISALFKRTFTTECHIRVKKMEGTVSASEAQIIQLDDFGNSKKIRLIEGAHGTLTFKNNGIIVELKLADPTDIRKVPAPFEFNGTYSLRLPGQ